VFAVLAYTVAAWGVSGWMYLWMAKAFGIDAYVGYGEGMGVLVITMLATTLPSPPGFAGVYEAGVRGALVLFGVAGAGLDATAVAYALVIHWWIFVVQATCAIYFLSVDGLSLDRVRALYKDAREGR
jgi:uncharacterized membrane protein YbhN (UPF0104 family)